MTTRRSSTLVTAIAAVVTASFVACAFAEGTLQVHVDQTGTRISPSLYGIFFEEINNAGDGGLYAEKIRNRSFEDADQPESWTTLNEGGLKATSVIDATHPRSDFNRNSLRVNVERGDTADANAGRAGVANEGYFGIGVEKGKTYDVMITARGADGFTGPLTVALIGEAGTIEAKTQPLTGEWGEQKVSIVATRDDPKARLAVISTAPGTFELDFVSMFPRETFRNRPNGLRVDLAEKLAALKPAFMRFPGGCWVEGDTMNTASRWKRTIGPVQDRWTQQNLWGYHSPNGLGYHEYLQLCEDINASALFVVNVGMSHHGNVPMDQMKEYVQDALDAIEYATGPADSTWGAKRAAAGHPAPFKLDYIEIGNENGGPAYNERYALYYDAIKKAHPQIKTVACLWNGRPSSRPIEILDEHYYESPRFFFRNTTKYDAYDRNGPKVYVGEYAVTKGSGAGNLMAALGEAAFMTGMERNSDVVTMASYAPLFTHVNGKRWNPDLINFDGLHSYGTPSYHVQQMFSNNRGDVVLPVTLKPDAAVPATPEPSKLAGKAGVGSWATQVEYKDFEVLVGDKVVHRGDAIDWSYVGKGEWKGTDGTLAQTGTETDVQAVTGDANWHDYSVHVKARKTGGKEGFLVVARYQSPGDYIWFNVGGWGNAGSSLERNREGEKSEISPRSDFKVESDRWYDLRLDVSGEQITAYVDGKQIAAAKDVEPGPMSMLAATASRDDASGDLIVKLVNGNATPQAFTVDLAGAKAANGKAKLTILAGKPADENTIAKPDNVAPKTDEVEVKGTSFTYTFPAYSATVVRVPTR